MKTTRKAVFALFALLAAVMFIAGGGFLSDSVAGAASAGPSAAGRYASVNGLKMYYEIHGTGRPLVLLHGALCTIDGCFGKILPRLAKSRQVIAIKHPNLVRKLVFMAAGYSLDAFHPGIVEGIKKLKPEDFAGSPWIEAYRKVTPNPNGWPGLLARVKQQVGAFKGFSPQAIRSMKAPTLIMIGASDVIRPEHSVQMFRLLGGGVAGDISGLPRSQLAILPGTTHVTIVERPGWLVSMTTQFLDAPTPKAK